MLFNYGKNNLKTAGTKIAVVTTKSSSNVTMSMSGSSVVMVILCVHLCIQNQS